MIGSVAATLLLAAASVVAVAGFSGQWNATAAHSCTVPALPGPLVRVTLTNMGGSMMNGTGGGHSAGAMRIFADHTTIEHGMVTFLATNRGTLSHELVILPLPGSERAGTRTIGGKGAVGETGSLGEASSSCGSGSGDGILPGTSGWVTVTLTPGRYELVCNIPGHYAAGMYTVLTVD